MLTRKSTNHKQKPDSGAKPASTLTQRAAAKILGVHFVHLNLVLKGHRISRSLSSRYAALQANQQEAK
jgi:hypothetical protein